MKVSREAALAGLPAGPDAFSPDCPTRVLLDHITSRWGVLILVALSSGTMRWGELRRWARGISEKMLAQTLRTLEADGLVLREQRPVVPPHAETHRPSVATRSARGTPNFRRSRRCRRAPR